MSYASWSRWVGVAAIVASSVMVGCASDSENATERQNEEVGQVAQEITGGPKAVGRTNQTICDRPFAGEIECVNPVLHIVVIERFSRSGE